MVRDHHATLLVLDGMVTAETLAKSADEYKTFISALQTWGMLVGCTVVFVTSSGLGGAVSSEHTMVDGIIELASERFEMRNLRYLSVTKLRGAAFLEGQHSYLITKHGLAVYPRTEAIVPPDGATPAATRVGTGVKNLDAALGGGIVARSTTLLLGSSGAGKTVMGLQFLAEGAHRGEKCLHFGFYESPQSIIAKGDRFGLDFSGLIDRGNLFVKWFRPAEIVIDALIHTLFEIVREQKIERLFIDGFVGFHSIHPSNRVSSVSAAVTDHLAAEGVTTLISDETRGLFIREVEVPTAGVSAIFHNILFMRQVEVGAQLERLIAIMKARDSAPDRRLWRYQIGERGLELLAPFAPADEPLMGGGQGGRAARPKSPSRSRVKPSRAKPARARRKGR